MAPVTTAMTQKTENNMKTNGSKIENKDQLVNPVSQSKLKKNKKDTSGNSLVICRNKHWKYISSFHGPWLQLPPEVLESLAYHNFATPRPHPIDPAVFFDLVKIRRLVDDATDIAVRAASGVASSSMASNYLPSINGNNASILGIGVSHPGSQTKLSRERRHRMRELATQKLAHAYTLDEIATSVATMQGTSTLEDVAALVLERSPNDPDAKYVHFFHEKIPSRMLATTTTLQPLTEVIAERPMQGAILRTRAVTRSFKEDYVGAVADLTAGLKVSRLSRLHESHQTQSTSRALLGKTSGNWSASQDDVAQPSSLETQLLFHRAGTYLTIACQHAETHISLLLERKKVYGTNGSLTNSAGLSVDSESEIIAKCDFERKKLRTNTKRALRDYLKLLEKFDYTPGTSNEGNNDSQLVHGTEDSYKPRHENTESQNLVYPISLLFTAPPPLPSYPASDLTLYRAQISQSTQPANPSSHEAVTYHPLLTDVLHSLLLCYTLLDTPPKELQRYAFMVARLARLCDGYPIFLAARSPARADWIEILKRSGDWINLKSAWEVLCAPAPLPNTKQDSSRSNGHVGTTTDARTDVTSRSLSALMAKGGDDNYGGGDYGHHGQNQTPRRWAQEDGREYPISTERAVLISRCVKERLSMEKNTAASGASTEKC